MNNLSLISISNIFNKNNNIEHISLYPSYYLLTSPIPYKLRRDTIGQYDISIINNIKYTDVKIPSLIHTYDMIHVYVKDFNIKVDFNIIKKKTNNKYEIINKQEIVIDDMLKTNYTFFYSFTPLNSTVKTIYRYAKNHVNIYNNIDTYNINSSIYNKKVLAITDYITDTDFNLIEVFNTVKNDYLLIYNPIHDLMEIYTKNDSKIVSTITILNNMVKITETDNINPVITIKIGNIK